MVKIDADLNGSHFVFSIRLRAQIELYLERMHRLSYLEINMGVYAHHHTVTWFQDMKEVLLGFFLTSSTGL
jgi:hypothetical protein